MLFDLLDHFEDALDVPLATFDDDQSHFGDERDVDVADEAGVAIEVVRRADRHARRVLIVLLAVRVLLWIELSRPDRFVLKGLLVGCFADQTESAFDPLGGRRVDRNDLRRPLRIDLGQIHRGDDLGPSQHVLRRALQADFVVPTVDRHDLARSRLGDDIELCEFAIVRGGDREFGTSDAADSILEFTPGDLLQFVLARLDRVGDDATVRVGSEGTGLLFDGFDGNGDLALGRIGGEDHQSTTVGLGGDTDTTIRTELGLKEKGCAADTLGGDIINL